jgi:3-oxoacyl-[acyl-carrier protein] reductase
MDLKGRICVVTGGGRGIGRATAIALASAGAHVAICARTESQVADVAAALPGGPHLSAAVDVAVSDSVYAFARRVMGELGAPDVLVNNAGLIERGRLDEMEEAAWDRVVDVNLKGTYLTTRAFLAPMRARQRGRIICVSSISGRRGTARSVAYCAAKHGIIGFVRALAEEVRAEGIVVNAISPGSVETDMLPAEFKPGMPAEEVARTILWLAADAPATLTGATIDQFG